MKFLSIIILMVFFNLSVFSVYSQDTDNDGVANSIDLDIDNDGILNADEKDFSPLNFSGLSTTSNTYSLSGITVTQIFNANTTGTIRGAQTDASGNLALDDEGQNTNEPFVDIDFNSVVDIKILPANNLGVNFDGNASTPSGDRWEISAPGVRFFVNDPNNELIILNNTTGSIRFGPTFGSNLISWSIIGHNIDTSVTDLRVTMLNGNPASDIRLGIAVDRNSDADGLADHLDTDSDGDGCSDANEYYNDPNADGNEGANDDEAFGDSASLNVDADGLVIGASYNSSTAANVIDANLRPACTFLQTSNGSWTTNGVWDKGVFPKANHFAEIDDGIESNVVQDVNIRDLVIRQSNGANPTAVDIANNFNLNITGNLTNNGEITGEGYVVFNGTEAQEILGDGTDAGSFSNIRLDNTAGLTITDDIELSDVLDIDNGNVTILNGDFITFKSNVTKTAILANTNGGSVDGCVVVERYIPAKRAFRFLSSPVNTDTAGCGVKPTINDNLQEGEHVTDFTAYDPPTANQDFGTHITGSTTGASGLDATQTGNHSMFNFNNSTGQFEEITSTNNPSADVLTTDQAFMLLVRGGRDMDLNVSNAEVGNETILRFTGELDTGLQNFTSLLNTGSEEFNGISNPYQAQVDLGQLLLNNTTDIQKTKAWIFDPTNADQFGAYVLIEFDASGNVDAITPQGSSPNPDDVNGFLQPNQSFFVQNVVTPTSPSLEFVENRKTTNSTTTTVFSDASDSTLKMNLYTATDDLRDGIIVRFNDNYSDAVNEEDALKLWNSLESFSTVQNGTHLTSDRRQLDGQNETVQLHLTNYTEENYAFEVLVENPENHTIYLIDNYLGTQTVLDNNLLNYDFSIDQNIPASVSPTRFQLVFEPSTLNIPIFQTNDFSVYPNPVKDRVNIDLSQISGKIQGLYIYDLIGKRHMEIDLKLEDEFIQVDMSSFSSGIYIMEIITDHNNYQHKLFKH